MSQKSGWQLCQDGPEAYEKYMVPAFSGAWAQDIVERAHLHKGERILDVGCGTGIVSRHAYQSMGRSVRITGVDINEVVIEKAREICPPDACPIEWKQANAEDLPFSDARFDIVLCQQGLQYFPNRSLALGEIRRVLAADGRIVFSVWRPLKFFPFYCVLHRALEKYVSLEAASILASAFALGDAEELRSLFESAGFSKIEVCLAIRQMRYAPFEEFLLGGFGASPFANEIRALEPSKRDEMCQMITESVSDYIDDQGLAAPMECYMVSAMK